MILITRTPKRALDLWKRTNLGRANEAKPPGLCPSSPGRGAVCSRGRVCRAPQEQAVQRLLGLANCEAFNVSDSKSVDKVECGLIVICMLRPSWLMVWKAS